ncbi:MFS transporter [Patulibacter minatonensis]|uniref:MFS transporter n=1 Tax=Patulibacter minatonensis TaxID=298163 RepID=UPI001FDEBEC5|nr:MFS transporter [Patulibacter minatonensis]
MSVAGEDAPTTRRGWVVAGLMATLALSALEGTIVATAAPQVVGDLGGFSLFGWVFSAYLLTQTVTIPLYGKLADQYGRKPVLLIGVSIFLAGSALCAAAWGMVALIVFRAVQGAGAGAIQATVQTVAGDLYAVEDRGRIQARLSSVWAVSALAGPVLGGVLAETLSWRWIFVLNVPVGLVAMAIVWRHLHEDVRRRAHRIDALGTALIFASAGLLVFALLRGGAAWDWLSAPSLAILAASAVAALLAVRVERRAEEPVMPPWVWRRRAFVGANLGMAGLGLLFAGPSIVLPVYGQLVLGLSVAVAGLLLASILIAWPVASSLAPRLYLRVGFRRSAMLGAMLSLAATAGFVLLPHEPSVVPVLVVGLVLGAGCGLLSVPLVVSVQTEVGWEDRGVATSTAMFCRVLGQSLGAAVFGAIANATLHAHLRDAPQDLRAQLPADVDGISRTLQGGAGLDDRAATYLGTAVTAATEHVFLGLAVAAAATLVVLALVMPRVAPPVPSGATAPAD